MERFAVYLFPAFFWIDVPSVTVGGPLPGVACPPEGLVTEADGDPSTLVEEEDSDGAFELF